MLVEGGKEGRVEAGGRTSTMLGQELKTKRKTRRRKTTRRRKKKKKKPAKKKWILGVMIVPMGKAKGGGCPPRPTAPPTHTSLFHLPLLSWPDKTGPALI